MRPREMPRSIDLLTWIQQGNPNLLTAAPEPAPFVPVEWSNPTSRNPAASSLLIPSRLTDLLMGQDQFFGAAGQVAPNTDWPIPTVQPYATSLRTFTHSTAIQLEGQDTFFGVAGNPVKDWPVPQGRVPAVTLGTWIGESKVWLVDQFFGLAGNPTFQWPVPEGRSPAPLSFTDSHKLTLTVELNTEPLFIYREQWEPDGRPYPQNLRGYEQATGILLTVEPEAAEAYLVKLGYYTPQVAMAWFPKSNR